MSRTAFCAMGVLDFGKLTDKQVERFDILFDRLCNAQMLPINQLDKDDMRQKLDKGILDILGISMELDDIYQQIIREPQFARKDITK